MCIIVFGNSNKPLLYQKKQRCHVNVFLCQDFCNTKMKQSLEWFSMSFRWLPSASSKFFFCILFFIVPWGEQTFRMHLQHFHEKFADLWGVNFCFRSTLNMLLQMGVNWKFSRRTFEKSFLKLSESFKSNFLESRSV